MQRVAVEVADAVAVADCVGCDEGEEAGLLLRTEDGDENAEYVAVAVGVLDAVAVALLLLEMRADFVLLREAVPLCVSGFQFRIRCACTSPVKILNRGARSKNLRNISPLFIRVDEILLYAADECTARGPAGGGASYGAARMRARPPPDSRLLGSPHPPLEP
jgi:hypothetical protein